MDKKQKATINPINKKENKCFQNAITAVLNYEEMGNSTKEITKIKPFINRYKWEGTNFPSEKDDWKRLEKNNITIPLNVLYARKIKKHILLTFQRIT